MRKLSFLFRKAVTCIFIIIHFYLKKYNRLEKKRKKKKKKREGKKKVWAVLYVNHIVIKFSFRYFRRKRTYCMQTRFF